MVTREFIQRDPRYPIPVAAGACVEFNYPNPHGRRLSLPRSQHRSELVPVDDDTVGPVLAHLARHHLHRHAHAHGLRLDIGELGRHHRSFLERHQRHGVGHELSESFWTLVDRGIGVNLPAAAEAKRRHGVVYACCAQLARGNRMDAAVFAHGADQRITGVSGSVVTGYFHLDSSSLGRSARSGRCLEEGRGTLLPEILPAQNFY